MKKILLALLLIPTLVGAAQQEIPVVPDNPVIPSIGSLRDAINLRLADIDENFDEIYPVLTAGPVYANPTAPADTKVVWIDTDQDNAIKVRIGEVWTVVGTAGEGSYTLPTAAADTLGGVKVGDRLSIADGVLSADVQTLGSAAYSDVVALWTTCTGYLKSDGTCDTPSGSATYPSAAGVANWNGSAWGTSYTVGTAANNLVQLNGSAQLPAVSAAMLTNFPTLNQDTAGNAATATALASNPTDCTAGQYATTIAANGNLTCAQVTYSQVGSTPTLGTAAALNVGTSANNIVQLNSSGELPFTISLFDTTANGVSLDPPTVTGSWMTFASTTGAASYLTPGTGVATALGNATGATGGLVTFNGAMGAPSFTALNLPSSDANPSTTAGQLRHDTTITELTGGALKYWNGTNVRTLVDLDTAPSTDDYVVAYDADADKFYMKADATAAGGMTWPSGAGIAVYSGSSTWGTSLTAPSGTIVGTSDTQTLTNKTLTAPIISDSSTLTFDESAADPNDADVVLSATDGVFKIAAANGANNENLTIDLDATANKAKFNSGSSLTLITTGSIPFTGAIRTVGKSSDYTIGTDDADEAYGSFFVNTGASTRVFTLPSAVAGMSVCVRNGQGTSQILRLDAGSGDYIVKPTGARTSAAAEYYGATADAKNQLCVVAYDATDWYVTSEAGTWTEE